MKTAFVTGASRGLGFAFVEYLLSDGYRVFAGVRKIKPDLYMHQNLTWIQCDVLDDVSIDATVKDITRYTESIDLLINNAGTNKNTISEGDKNLVSKLGSLSREALLNMFNINTISPIIITQKFLPLLNCTPSFVINISSARASYSHGHSASTANYGYAASKAALNMMTFCSEVDLPRNVKTFAVNPGGMKTNMNPERTIDPKIRAVEIINFTKTWKDEYNGRFFNYDGKLYPL